MRKSMVLLADEGVLADMLLRKATAEIVASSEDARRACKARQGPSVWVASSQRSLDHLRGMVAPPSGNRRLLLLDSMDHPTPRTSMSSTAARPSGSVTTRPLTMRSFTFSIPNSGNA